ncbi:MAG TPA: LCP family protein [Candidatus Dormibacteraeota bacterium]
MVQEETRLNRRGLIAVAVILVLLVAFVAIRGGVFISRISSSGLGGLGGLFGVSELQHKLDSGQRVNILLLGYGGPNHDGPYLTDSIMVVSLDPVTSQTAYISIPRDTEVTFHAFSDPRRSVTDKINAAFEVAMQSQNWGGGLAGKYQSSDQRDGAFRLADDVISQVTGLHIDYNVGADFSGFDKIVDAMGGIDINVPESFSIDVPAGRNGWITLFFQQGWTHMNGATALYYVRGRYTACSETGWWSYRNGQRLCGGHAFTDADTREASDFARAQRQQTFLEAFRKRALKLNAIANLPTIVSGLEAEVRTDMAIPSDAQALWSDQGKLRRNGILHISLNSGNLLYSCTCDQLGYTLHTYGDGSMLRQYLATLFQAPAIKEKAPIRLVDASGDGGQLSAVWKDLLSEMGFPNVTDAGSAGRDSTTGIADGTSGKAKHTLAFLSSFFKAQPGAQAPAAGAVTLVLGRDAYSAFYANGAQTSSSAAASAGQRAGGSGSGGGSGGGGGGGTGGGGAGHPSPSPFPVPLPSLFPSPPFKPE